MKFHFALAALPLLIAAGCTDKGGTSSNDAARVATAPSTPNWIETVSKTAQGGYRMGNPDAPVKLIEFGSRTCPHCAEFAATGIAPLKANYVATGKVSYEFRDYLRNGADLAAAMIGECNGPQQFFPMLEAMYAGQPAVLDKAEALDDAFYNSLAKQTQPQQSIGFARAVGYIDLAKQHGLPEAKANQCLSDTAHAQALVKMTDTADAMPIPGTPTFLINGKQVENTVSWPELETALKGAGA